MTTFKEFLQEEKKPVTMLTQLRRIGKEINGDAPVQFEVSSISKQTRPKTWSLYIAIPYRMHGSDMNLRRMIDGDDDNPELAAIMKKLQARQSNAVKTEEENWSNMQNNVLNFIKQVKNRKDLRFLGMALEYRMDFKDRAHLESNLVQPEDVKPRQIISGIKLYFDDATTDPH